MVIGLHWCTPNRLRSAKNVSKCGQIVFGALVQGRIHNPKVGGSIPPPATNKINNLRSSQLSGLGVPTPTPLSYPCIGSKLIEFRITATLQQHDEHLGPKQLQVDAFSVVRWKVSEQQCKYPGMRAIEPPEEFLLSLKRKSLPILEKTGCRCDTALGLQLANKGCTEWESPCFLGLLKLFQCFNDSQ